MALLSATEVANRRASTTHLGVRCGLRRAAILFEGFAGDGLVVLALEVTITGVLDGLLDQVRIPEPAGSSGAAALEHVGSLGPMRAPVGGLASHAGAHARVVAVVLGLFVLVPLLRNVVIPVVIVDASWLVEVSELALVAPEARIAVAV